MMALVALPFTKMFVFGMQGSNENSEHIVAYNLAREKIEEIKSLPFEIIKSDFDNFRDVYADRPGFEAPFENKVDFEKTFSDIITQEMIQQDDTKKETYEKLRNLYKSAYFRDFELCPDEVKGFRRVIDVDDKIDNSVPPRLKKITVFVFDQHGHKFAEVVTLISKHK